MLSSPPTPLPLALPSSPTTPPLPPTSRPSPPLPFPLANADTPPLLTTLLPPTTPPPPSPPPSPPLNSSRLDARADDRLRPSPRRLLPSPLTSSNALPLSIHLDSDEKATPISIDEILQIPCPSCPSVHLTPRRTLRTPVSAASRPERRGRGGLSVSPPPPPSYPPSGATGTPATVLMAPASLEGGVLSLSSLTVIPSSLPPSMESAQPAVPPSLPVVQSPPPLMESVSAVCPPSPHSLRVRPALSSSPL